MTARSTRTGSPGRRMARTTGPRAFLRDSEGVHAGFTRSSEPPEGGMWGLPRALRITPSPPPRLRPLLSGRDRPTAVAGSGIRTTVLK